MTAKTRARLEQASGNAPRTRRRLPCACGDCDRCAGRVKSDRWRKLMAFEDAKFAAVPIVWQTRNWRIGVSSDLLTAVAHFGSHGAKRPVHRRPAPSCD